MSRRLLHETWYVLFSIDKKTAQLRTVSVYMPHYLLTSTFVEDSQAAIACSKLTIETLEQGVKYVQS